jgi:hypothetical protein
MLLTILKAGGFTTLAPNRKIETSPCLRFNRAESLVLLSCGNLRYVALMLDAD